MLWTSHHYETFPVKALLKLKFSVSSWVCIFSNNAKFINVIIMIECSLWNPLGEGTNNGMFGLDDFREDEKKRKENIEEKMVGREGGT